MSMKAAPALRTNAFFQIEINHLPTSKGASNNAVLFEGWVTEFSDDFTSNWNSETVYGRMDPLVTFQNTQREITLGFDVVSDNAAQAQTNIAKVNRLIEFLYPVYDSDPELATQAESRGQQNVLKASPLLSLRWTNLAASAMNNAPLIGHMRGLNYSPDVSQGGFVFSSETSSERLLATEEVLDQSAPVGAEPTHTIYEVERENIARTLYVPKVLSLNFSFVVLHTHLGGWYKKDGSYVFGSSEIDGKFPNAQNVALIQTEIIRRTVDSEGELVDTTTISGSVQQIAEQEVLGG
jgi:hypothetical protein